MDCYNIPSRLTTKGRIVMHSSVIMRFPGGKSKAFTMSYDDGVEQDIRLIELMQKQGVKGTFNLNSDCFAAPGTTYPAGQVHRRMTQEQCLALYQREGVEVAGHATGHGFLQLLPQPAAILQIVEDRKNLERLTGKIVRGFAYPYGTFNDTVVESLRACGVAYARTTLSTHKFDMPTDWLRLNPTCHHNDERLFELTDQFLNESPRREPWLFYLWGHAYEFEGRDNWNLIEEFLPRIGGHEDVWYATNIEIYEYARAFDSLVFSVDSALVTNPSAQDVYVLIDEKPVCIPAGCVNMQI